MYNSTMSDRPTRPHLRRVKQETGATPDVSDRISLDLSREEFETLMHTLFVANWVIFGTESEPTPALDRYEELEQKVLSLADDIGLSDQVELVREENKRFPSIALEDELLHRFLDPYNNDVFWNELADRLAERDVLEEYGQDKFDKMHPSSKLEILDDRSDWYYEEFMKAGVDSLRIRPRLEVVKKDN